MATKTRSIRQTAWIRASPEQVYQTLMTTKGHSAFTGAPARISPRVGGRFMAWDGYIHGSNLELVPGRRIVQTWRPTEADWPKNHDSKVTIRLGPSRGGTRLQFVQEKVLAQHAGHLADGWKSHYWAMLNAYLAPPARLATRGPKSGKRTR